MADILIFGGDFSHADYVVPMVKIKLYDPKSSNPRGDSPIMYIRMGGTFNTRINAAYDDAQGIVGTRFETDQEVIKTIGSVVGGAFTGLQAQALRALYGVGGTIASAGLSGRSQAEFLKQTFLNNFQQVVYRGPQFRRYTLPLVMKPTSRVEAQRMRRIIYNLKLATVPKVSTDGDYNTFLKKISSVEDLLERKKELEGRAKSSEKDEKANIINQIALIDEEQLDIQETLELIDKTNELPLTFGYPDACDFEIVLYKSGTELTEVFKSRRCVIEDINVDYGSSNKMTFFDDDNSKEYYPTEVTLTLSLKELEFQTDVTMLPFINDTKITLL